MAVDLVAILLTLLPLVGGFLGSIISSNAIQTWYPTLKKPSWSPPNWVFGPVWSVLYIFIGYASYLVYRDGGGFEGKARLALEVYAANIIVNWLWTPIFFAFKNIKGGLYDILLIDITALAVGILFVRINALAGFLIVPYFVWLGIATGLNAAIYLENKAKNQ